MTVLCIYGFGQDLESDGPTGLRWVQQQLRGEAPDELAAVDFREATWKQGALQVLTEPAFTPPLLVVGYSFGGSRAVDLAWQIHSEKLPIVIDHLVLLDPVPVSDIGLGNDSDFVLPPCVHHATCYWRGGADPKHPLRGPVLPPWSRPILSAEHPFTNISVPIGHGDFGGEPRVWGSILGAALGLRMPERPVIA